MNLAGEHTGQNVDDFVVSIQTTYDDLGRVQTVTSRGTGSPAAARNRVAYTYDGWGNVLQEYQAHTTAEVDNGTGASVQYHYDDGYATAGSDRPVPYLRLGLVTYPNGREVEYGYGYGDSQSQNIDEVVDYIMSRLETISDSSGALASYKYLGAGQIAVEDYAQSQVKLDYDPDGDNSFAGLDRFGRIHDQVWEQYHLEGGNEVVDGAVDEYIYGYDRAGNRVSKSNELDHDLDETYVYDNLDRLTEWYVGGSQTPSETWTLDSLGNNLDAGAYNAANEETPTGQGGDPYDAAGNMITLRSGNSAIYDAWNRMTKVTTGSGENLTIFQQNVYDGTNRRIQIFTDFNGSTPGTVADDYFSGQQVIETRQDAAVQYQYIWSPRYIDAPILRDTYHTVESERVIDAAQRIFYLGDANYNVTGLVKQVETESGTEWQVVERYTYTPYGVVTVRAGDTWDAIAGNVSQENNTILYTGRTVDLATGGLQNVDLAAGLMYYRARFYDAVLERFINRDPIAADVNLYRYVGDSPLGRTDATGLCAMASVQKGVARAFVRPTVLDSGSGRKLYRVPKRPPRVAHWELGHRRNLYNTA